MPRVGCAVCGGRGYVISEGGWHPSECFSCIEQRLPAPPAEDGTPTITWPSEECGCPVGRCACVMQFVRGPAGSPVADSGTGTPEQSEVQCLACGQTIASMKAAPPEPDTRAVIEKLRKARGIVNEPMGVSVNEADRAVRLLTEAIDELAAAVKGER